MTKYNLSPTTLNLFINCPRCFWLHINHGIKRPRGIFPSLPGGMDSIIKNYFDQYRIKGELPEEIEGAVTGKLFSDIDILKKWRSWKLTNLRYEDKTLNTVLTGALDDCIVEDEFFIPLDYKTRGWEIKENSSYYYQTQLDCYCLILESSGYKTKGIAYLVYYWPEEVIKNGIVKFRVKPIKMKTNIESARRIVNDAITLLSGTIPKSHPDCEYCNLVINRKGSDEHEK
ncbi:MAG: PD-(D/E)XK nuclease family protein [Candidatus Omnitrophota bacterium]